ncbi:MAG TPA: 2-hydroxychromene-2-carboxylate isomerase [Azospirillaceae bacterium]|nr:2-hydroxychromene-2-carboxylate isomerase [Azospirillaceae bacterium]
MAAIEFWFDFSSPYAYFAAQRIDEVAERHGRTAVWRPFLLGAAFKSTGMGPLLHMPLRGEYARHDWERIARWTGTPYSLPDKFPYSGLQASRAFYWLDAQDPELARRFARRVFRAYFADGIDPTTAEVVADLAAAEGVDREAALAAMADPAIKERLKAETEGALARGIFGSPFMVADGEGFWGFDRIPMLEAWLTSGGW